MEFIVDFKSNGTMKIPQEIQEKLKLKAGDNLILRYKEGKVELEKQITSAFEGALEIQNDLGLTRKVDKDFREEW